MDSTGRLGERDGVLPEGAAEPHCGTPLGVEAAWCPNGIDVLRLTAATETTMQPPEL